MRVLFTGYHNPKFETITEYCEKGLSSLSYDLYKFDDRKFLFPGRLRDKFKLIAQWDLKRLNKRLMKLIEKSRPDLLVVTGGHRIFPETIEFAKKRNIKTVLWTIDPPIYFEVLKDYAKYYDKVFCGGSEAQILLQGIRDDAMFLPFGFDSFTHQQQNLRKDETQYVSDIVFIGSHYKNRETLFESIADLNFSIWGPGWSKLDDDSRLRKCVKSYIGVPPKVWLKALSGAKMTVVAHYDDGKILCNQVSPKVYEAMACKVLVFCDKQKDAQELFADKENIVFYETQEELREKVGYYLANENARNKIVDNAYELVQKKHSYKERMRKLVEECFAKS